MGYLAPGRDTPRAQPNGKSSWETAVAAAVAVAAVIWSKYEQKCDFFKIDMSQNSRNRYFSGINPPAGFSHQRSPFQDLPLMN